VLWTYICRALPACWTQERFSLIFSTNNISFNKTYFSSGKSYVLFYLRPLHEWTFQWSDYVPKNGHSCIFIFLMTFCLIYELPVHFCNFKLHFLIISSLFCYNCLFYLLFSFLSTYLISVQVTNFSFAFNSHHDSFTLLEFLTWHVPGLSRLQTLAF